MECLQTISVVHRALGDNGALPPDVLHDLEHLLPHGGAGGENLDVVRRQLYSALKTVIKIGWNIMSCHLESSDIFSRCHVVLIVGPLAGGERQEVGGHLDNVKELPGVFRHEVVELGPQLKLGEGGQAELDGVGPGQGEQLRGHPRLHVLGHLKIKYSLLSRLIFIMMIFIPCH